MKIMRERVNISLDPEIYEALRKYAKETNIPASRIIERHLMTDLEILKRLKK